MRLVEDVSASEVPARASALEQENYSIHFHVWGPWEFRAMVDYAIIDRGLPLGIEALVGNEHEFIVILRRI